MPVCRSCSASTSSRAQTENKKFRGIIRQLKDDVESGSTFTEALRKHNKVFDDLFVNMISAGEIGGILDTILQRLSVYMEKSMKLKAKIKGAMIYPATIITVAGGVTAVLLIWVIPVFAELFASFGQALPAPTQFVINLSNFTIAYFHFLILGMVAAAVAVRYSYKTENGRHGDGPRHPPDARLRRPDPQVVDRPLHAHAQHAGLLRRADPRRAPHHRQDLRQQGRRARHPGDAR